MNGIQLTKQNLDQLNADNLTGLWKLMAGSAYTCDPVSGIHSAIIADSDWPNKLWLDYDRVKSTRALERLKKIQLDAGERNLITLWPVNQAEQTDGWENLKVYFSQQAMFIDLSSPELPGDTDLDFRIVDSRTDAGLFARLASESFGYKINPEPFELNFGNENLTSGLAYLDNEAAGCGLLFEDRDVMGFHMIGVLEKFRRRGLARNIMRRLIHLARRSGKKFGTLQASVMGAPLYHELGFQTQFEMHNYCPAFIPVP